MKDFKQYYGKFVYLLIDGMDYDLVGGNVHQEGAVPANKSIKIYGRIVGENECFLNLEDVVTFGVLGKLSADKFKRGHINKDYLIGLFESSSFS